MAKWIQLSILILIFSNRLQRAHSLPWWGRDMRDMDTTAAPYSFEWNSSEEVVTTTPSPSITTTATTTTTTDPWATYDYVDYEDFTTTTKKPKESLFGRVTATEAISSFHWGSSEEVVTTRPSPSTTPTTTTTTTTDPWANYVYEDYDFTTTTKRTKKSKSKKTPGCLYQKPLWSELTEPTTTTPPETQSIYTTTSNTLGTTTTIPTNTDSAQNVLTRTPAISQTEKTPPLPFTQLSIRENSFAVQYAERSQNLLAYLKDEFNYNQYVAAAATYLEAGEMLKFLQQNLTNLLQTECRKSEFPHLHQRYLSLLVSDHHHQFVFQGNEQTCQTSREAVNENIQKFEEFLHAKKIQKEQAATVQENLIKELESYHKRFHDSLHNTLGVIAHGKPHERRISLLTQEVGQSRIENISGGSASVEGVEITGNDTEILSIPDQFERIEKLHREKKISEREKVDDFTSLIDQVEEAGLNENPEIFELAVLIKNCKGHTHIVPYVEHLFPAQVQHVVWGMKNHLKIFKNATKFKVYADDDNNLQALEILHSNSTKNGDAWKFIPMNEGKSFVLYNIDRNSVLKVIPAQNATIIWPTEAELTMESVAGRDVTMLHKRSEYLWQIILHCKPMETDSAFLERTRLVDKEMKCYIVFESQFYANLALNFNPLAYMSLKDKRDPGLFVVKNVN